MTEFKLPKAGLTYYLGGLAGLCWGLSKIVGSGIASRNIGAVLGDAQMKLALIDQLKVEAFNLFIKENPVLGIPTAFCLLGFSFLAVGAYNVISKVRGK